MIKTDVMDQVAQTFRANLNGNTFASTNRKEILCRVREVSGNHGLRLTEATAKQLQARADGGDPLSFHSFPHP